MHSLSRLAFLLLTTISVVLPPCWALELQEIRPWNGRGMGPSSRLKRDMSVFELKSTETFLWGAKGQANSSSAKPLYD